jgi:hypothetical protein
MNNLRFHISPLSRPQLSVWIWSLAYGVVLVFRVFLCAEAPTDTSDLFRHAGFSSHLGLDLYDRVPADYEPEFWTQFWSTQKYIYPPGVLMFFSLFSMLGLGLFWMKLTLTLCELASSFVIARVLGLGAGLLVFSAPVSVWYTSHEGQFEGLLGLFIVMVILAANRRKWLVVGLTWMVALQLKQFAVLLGPFLLARILAGDWHEKLQGTERFAIGLVLGFGPFAVFYWQAPDLWLRPLQVQGLEFVYNPFHWKFWEPWRFEWLPPWLIGWNSLTTYLTLAIIFGFIVIRCRIVVLLESSPLMLFWLMVKSLNWAEYWYTILVPSFTFCLANYRRLAITLLAIHWLQYGRSVELLHGHEFGWHEKQATIDRFNQCVWMCDYQASR